MTGTKTDADLASLMDRYREQHHMSIGEMCRLLGLTRQRWWDWQTRGVPEGNARLVRLAMRAVQKGLH